MRVQLLGAPTFVTPSGELRLLPQIRLLASYLFFYRGERVPRSKLADLFWPEADADRGSANLRNALYVLRSALAEADEDGQLHIERDTVCVPASAACEIDAHLFEVAVRAALSAKTGSDLSDLIGGLSLYKGEFLSGMDRCPWAVTDWYLPERQRLRDLYVSGLSALVRRFAETDLPHAALDYAIRWRDTDPLSEEASRTLMSLYAETGQPARVASEFDRCCEALEQELGVSPTEKTIQTYRQMSSMAAKRKPTPPDPADVPKVRELSSDPVRNAHLLLILGEQKAMQGETAEGMQALEEARAIFEDLGNRELEHRARLTMAGVRINTPYGPRPDLALAEIEPLLPYYREQGSAADLGRALLIAADALQQCSAYQEAAALAREGLELARAIGNADLEVRLDLVRGLALTYASEFAEATEALDSAISGLARLYRPREMLRAITGRGVLAMLNETMASCEQYLLEAIAIASRLPRTPVTVFTEGYARGMLVILYWGLDRQDEARALATDVAFDLGSAPGGNVLQAICLPGKDAVASARTAARLLRESLASLPAWPAVGFSRILWQQLMLLQLHEDALRWSAVNIRLSRRLRQRLYEGTGYSCRGITLVRLGRIRPAEACLERATALLAPEHHYSMAYLAYLKAMIAKAKGDLDEADARFDEASSLWRGIGESNVIRMVEKDMARVRNG